ncbi:MAG TPA: AAA family ATPase [Acidimicrobiales bacterium]|nr:AAA family ATPase [Acidimicrobiales bacterium]
MRVVLVGGAPGVGKTAMARRLLELAETGRDLVQWVDVDSLWLHQPWRVDERSIAMVEANLRAVAEHAARAGVDVLVITWVFQSAEMHRIVTGLLPPATESVSVQLHARRAVWEQRFAADPERRGINERYEDGYRSAQATPVDHVVDTDGLTPMEVARRVADLVGLGR